MRDAKPFITINNIAVRVHDQIRFAGLSWELRDDQQWAVMGANGAGKSTLMKALCGALPIVQGEIVYHFCERDPHAQIAYVIFENQRSVLRDDAFYQARWNVSVSEDELSVSDWLAESNIRRINPFQVIDHAPDPTFATRRAEIIAQLELESLLAKNVIQLSNGERRKVAIARALLKQPKLLILDNPFGGLDERYRGKFTRNLENLMQSDLRVIIVGTNRDEIPAYITHVLRVERDHVVAHIRDVGATLVVAPIGELPTGRIPGRPQGRSPKRPTGRPTGRPQGQPQGRPQGRPHGRPQGSPLRESDSSRKIFVQMKNVNVAYNGTQILRGVNWTVRENENWALLGANGAGKTTLLSLILADNPQAYANDITLFGKPRGSGESIWEIKQHIGWVAPELQLYYPRGATCFDVVCAGWFDSVGLYHQCADDQRASAQTWLERVGLAEYATTRFDHLAEGEQRLALLARALVKNPTLLVLDEPCQGLDENNRDHILQMIDATRRPDTSLIYVTHRADELPKSITHILRLDQGQIVEL